MKKRILSLGKQRGLSQCANEQFIFNILALDHRQVIKKVFMEQPDPYAESVKFKRAVVKALAPSSTAILLDNSIGAGPCIVDYSLPGQCGLVLTVEASGYEGSTYARISRLKDDWGCEEIKRMGASALKLLVYYHSQSEVAPAMRDLVAKVSDECNRLDISLFLEVLTYSPNPNKSNLSSEEKTKAVVQAAADLTPIGGDVYKAEFPVDVKSQPNSNLWVDACKSLNQASEIPWVILSAGVDYPIFTQQTEVACKAGASGILAGRAIWKEALEVPISERDIFLLGTGRERLQHLYSICNQYAHPYTEFFDTEVLAEDWFKTYSGF